MKKFIVKSGTPKVQKGFTLIELLVVIAIISLLAAILFPVFARARENARRASCQSNLKQLALGVSQYKLDYDSKYPMLSRNPDGSGPWSWAFMDSNGVSQGTSDGDAIPWYTGLDPYLKNTQILTCPDMQVRGFNNYFYNGNLGVGVGFECQNAANSCIKNESQLIGPASTIMMGDGGRFNRAQTANCYSSVSANCPETNPTGGAAPPAAGAWADSLPNAWPSAAQITDYQTRHLGGINFAFCDGHVKWETPDKMTYDNPSTGKPTFNAVGIP